MHLGPADGLYFRSQPIFHPCSVHSPGPACEICCLKAKIWSFLLLGLIVYKFNTKFNPFSKKIHPKLSSVVAFYLPSKFRSGVERYDEMRDLEKDRRGCSSTPPTQPCTSSYQGLQNRWEPVRLDRLPVKPVRSGLTGYRLPVKPVWAGTKPAQIQNLNLN